MSVVSPLANILESVNQVAYINAKKMEELIYEDPSSALIKARLFAEAILEEVFKFENINEPYLSSLYERISYLAKNGFITQEIQSAFDTIRLTGNRAAHDGTYNDLMAALRLHKVMYKIAVWFIEVYTSNTQPIPLYEHPKPQKQEIELEGLVKKKLLDLVKEGYLQTYGGNTEQADSPEEPAPSQDDEPIPSDGYLLNELKKLRDSSREAVENAKGISDFKKYLHVDRKVQKDIEGILSARQQYLASNLILLCGSVGDGKSHLLARLGESLKGYHIYNDATESFSPDKNAMETLEDILKNFSDQMIDKSRNRVILAINLGVLHNFIYQEHKDITFERLGKFVEQSGLFSEQVTTCYSYGHFDLVSFSDYQSYELVKSGPKSSFFSELLSRVTENTQANPFYKAYQKDNAAGIHSMAHENYEFLQEPFVREQIVNLVIQTIVRFKLVVSARAFLNFIADILVQDGDTPYNLQTDFERLEYSLPSLLFNRQERSEILRHIYQLDPVHIRSPHIDQILVSLNTLNDWNTVLNETVQSEKGETWIRPFVGQEDTLSEHTFSIFSSALVRTAFLSTQGFSEKVRDTTYEVYMKKLYGFNVGDKTVIKETYDEVKEALFKWQGSPHKDYVYMNQRASKYMLAQKLNLKPNINHIIGASDKDSLDTFKSTLRFGYQDVTQGDVMFLEIDFQLYRLLESVRRGYCPNKKDREDAVRFVEFIGRSMRTGNKKEELLINFIGERRMYSLKRNDFGAFAFEREI